MRYQQDLQVSIRERLRRLVTADPEDAGHEIRLVTDWIDEQPALRAVLAEAGQAEPELDPAALGARAHEWRHGLSAVPLAKPDRSRPRIHHLAAHAPHRSRGQQPRPTART